MHRAPLLKGYTGSKIHSEMMARLWYRPIVGKKFKAAAAAGSSLAEPVSFSGWIFSLL